MRVLPRVVKRAPAAKGQRNAEADGLRVRLPEEARAVGIERLITQEEMPG
jgi:hypothetical protein